MNFRKVLAFVPARAGSKRVPGKNTRMLNGHPLIQYSLNHAKAAKTVTDIVVSSDDSAALAIAKANKCHSIFRPAELATDSTPTLDVVLHAIEYLKKQNLTYEAVLLLQPTVPLRDSKKIDEAVTLLFSTGCDSVISHIRVDYFHPNRMKSLVDGKVLPYCEQEIEGINRDALPPAYYRDGAIYVSSVRSLLKNRSIMGKDIRAVINSPDFFVNIDNERDWKIAELLVSQAPTGVLDEC